jgi:hypothetical protein
MSSYDKLKDLAKHYKIQLIPGIEISAEHRPSGEKVHILGYYLDMNSQFLQKVCRDMTKRREEATRDMLSKVAGLGYRIGPEEVAPFCMHSTNLYKVHIMHALFHGGYSQKIKDVSLYKELFPPGGKAFVPLEYIPVEEAISAVRNGGGVAVLAHPGVHKNHHLFPYLLELGIQGIEAYHPGNSPQDTAWCLQKAKKYGLVITGGSDFHGLYGDFSHLLGSLNPGNDTVMALSRKAGVDSQ